MARTPRDGMETSALASFPILPLLSTVGYLMVFWGMFLIARNLYHAIPYVGETLEDAAQEPIHSEERLQIRSIGVRGLVYIFSGFGFQIATRWLEWAMR